MDVDISLRFFPEFGVRLLSARNRRSHGALSESSCVGFAHLAAVRRLLEKFFVDFL